MSKRIERGRHELQRAKRFIDHKGCVADEQPGDDQEQEDRQHEPGHWREHDRGAGLGEATPHDRLDSDLGGTGADQAADQRMRAR